MEVKKGYKQTEVGVIPEDWLDSKVGDLVDFEGGSQPDKSVFSAVPKAGYIRLIQIRDYKSDRFETYIPRQLARRFCNENDIMIGRYGPPIFQILRGISGAYNVALIKAIPRDGLDDQFAYYFFTQQNLFAFVERLSQRSSGQTGVDLRELRAYPLPLPSVAEQRAIADALSDADALIESLEQLLAKKRAIKQGAMQELLTGKRRLPGFSGEWERGQSTIGDIAEVGRGRVISHKEISRSRNPQYPVYSSQTTSNGVMGYIDTYDFEGDYVTWTTDGANAGTVFYRTGKFNCTNVCGTIKLHFGSHPFVAKVLAGLAPQYVSRHLGNPKLMNDVMKSVKIPLPPTTMEQESIAAVLSDMDVEIAAIEAKLSKARQVKQGMMQELLTGRIRLV